MKKYIYTLSALIVTASAFGAGVVDYSFVNGSTNTVWTSLSNWTYKNSDNETVNPEVYPNSNLIAFRPSWNSSGVSIDVKSVTVANIYTNSSIAVSKGGTFVCEMQGTVPEDGSDATLNLDGTNVAWAHTQVSQLTAADYYYAIILLSASYKENENPNTTFEFSGGTINVSDPSRKILISATGGTGSSATTTANKTMSFTNGNILNLKNDTAFSGVALSSQVNYSGVTSTINLDGVTNVMDDNKNLKTLTVYSDSNAGDFSRRVLNLNVGGVLTSGDVTVMNNTAFNVTGTANVGNLTTKSGSLDVNIKTGGILTSTGAVSLEKGTNFTVAGTASSASFETVGSNVSIDISGSYSTTGNFYVGNKGNTKFNLSGTLNVGNGLRFANSGFGLYSGKDNTIVETSSTSEITAKYLRLYLGANASFNGEMNITSQTSAASFYANGSKVVFEDGLTINAVDPNGRFQTGGSKIDVYSKTGSLIFASGTIVSDATGDVLTLHTENPFAKSDTIGQEAFVIRLSKDNIDYQLNLNANQDFNYFEFASTGVTMNLVLSDAVTDLDLTSLAGGTLTEAKGANLVIDGFKENTIHISSWNSADDFSRISSKNGDWVDFGIDANGYLTATYIPEPSFYAVCAGLLSLATVIYRRRK